MARAKIRAFLDTNVIFSGLYSAKGAPEAIIDYYAQGYFTTVVSRQMLDELIGTLKDKLPEALPTLRSLLVNMSPEVVADPRCKLPGVL